MEDRENLIDCYNKIKLDLNTLNINLAELKDAFEKEVSIYEEEMTKLTQKPYKLKRTPPKSTDLFKSYECFICGKKSKIIKEIIYHKHLKPENPSDDVITLAEFCKKG